MIVAIPFWRPGGGATGLLYDPNPWSTVYLGRRQMPGTVSIPDMGAKWLAEVKTWARDQKQGAPSRDAAIAPTQQPSKYRPLNQGTPPSEDPEATGP